MNLLLLARAMDKISCWRGGRARLCVYVCGSLVLQWEQWNLFKQYSTSIVSNMYCLAFSRLIWPFAACSYPGTRFPIPCVFVVNKSFFLAEHYGFETVDGIQWTRLRGRVWQCAQPRHCRSAPKLMSLRSAKRKWIKTKYVQIEIIQHQGLWEKIRFTSALLLCWRAIDSGKYQKRTVSNNWNDESCLSEQTDARPRSTILVSTSIRGKDESGRQAW